jgi:hypothetical protein
MAETVEERDLRTAVEIAHVHLALNSPKSQNWAARVKRRSSLAGVPVAPLTDALDRLEAHDGGGGTSAARFHHRHAHAVLAQVHNLTHRHSDNRSQSRILRERLKKTLLGALPAIEAASPLGAALGQAYDPLLNLQITGPCDVDDAGVTRFYAQATRARKAKGDSFLRLARNTNPKNWPSIFPQQFSYAYETNQLSGPRTIDPTKLPGSSSRPHKSWDGFLFETFAPTFCGLPVSSFRNILAMRFKAEKTGATTGEIGFEYQLLESLTNRVPFEGPERAGGIDVDSNQPGSCTVVLNAADVEIKAGKNIRFSSETGVFQEELNLTALPLLAMWIVTLLLQPAVTN